MKTPLHPKQQALHRVVRFLRSRAAKTPEAYRAFATAQGADGHVTQLTRARLMCND